MKKYFILFYLLLVGCGTLSLCQRVNVNSPPFKTSLTILSFNMLGVSLTASRDARMIPLVQVCKENNVDILLLQESIWQPNEDRISLLRGALGGLYDCTEAPTFGVWPFQIHDIGILSKYPFIAINSADCTIKMTGTLDNMPLPNKKRVVTATINVSGVGVVNVASTHMASCPVSEEERQNQVKMIVGFIETLPKADMDIIGGDFNFDNNNLAYSILTSMGYIGCDVGIDHIMVRGGKFISCQEVLNDHYSSDHSGVLATVSK
jgi:endonuclease/exonuclease/phosphatase family metal-dependent hydrolase